MSFFVAFGGQKRPKQKSDIAQFSIVSTLQQINDGRDGKPPEGDVVDDGEEVDGDGAVGEEQARGLLQFALEDLKQGAGLDHGEELRVRLVGMRRHIELISGSLEGLPAALFSLSLVPGALLQTIASTLEGNVPLPALQVAQRACHITCSVSMQLMPDSVAPD